MPKLLLVTREIKDLAGTANLLAELEAKNMKTTSETREAGVILTTFSTMTVVKPHFTLLAPSNLEDNQFANLKAQTQEELGQ
jgi:hypothetical protein